MASIVVRGLDEEVKQRLADQARRHGRSMEAEVRSILASAVHRPNIAVELMDLARECGGVDLDIPERVDQARAVDFG